MAKSAKQWIKGLLGKAWEAVKDLPRKMRPKKADVEAQERRRIADKVDRSVSQVRQIEKGERPGRNLEKPLSKIKPKAAPKEKAAPVILTPLEKAERKLDRLDGTDRYVIHITNKKTGKSFTICRKGGVSPDTVRRAPSLGDFIAAQGGAQGYETDFDWSDVVDIEFEEYY